MRLDEEKIWKLHSSISCVYLEIVECEGELFIVIRSSDAMCSVAFEQTHGNCQLALKPWKRGREEMHAV